MSFQNTLHRAYGPIGYQADFKAFPEDFQVNEALGVSPSGSGEHLLLRIRKTSQNTHWVAKLLAEYVGVSEKDVGYCGRKDRHAITTQWFSLYMPKQQQQLLTQTDRQWHDFKPDGVELLEQHWHKQKLRRGVHQANHFKIRLRSVCKLNAQEALTTQDKLQLAEKLNQITKSGVPNYFGEQRFGREGKNLESAQKWFAQNQKPSRREKSMILSSARSYLFNRVLAQRVADNNWDQLIEGDVPLDSKPSGPLWGRGRSAAMDDALTYEQQVLAPWAQWCDGLGFLVLAINRPTPASPVSFNWPS